MKLSDFDYGLPPELIAQYPLPERAASRLLFLEGVSGQIQDLMFRNLQTLLQPEDLLVFNDTRVMPARLYGRKESGGKVEILIERLLGAGEALVQVRTSKAPKPGSRLLLGEGDRVAVVAREGDLFRLQSESASFTTLMVCHGHVPLPPYIRRPDDAVDLERYQTVFAREEGAVAAPTAGLHFDQAMLDGLAELGVELAHVTLHVGAGTFQPVRVHRLEDHVMHQEYLKVEQQVCEQVARTRSRGGRVIAVGTTSVRSLETAAADGELRPYRGETRLFIWPGYRFRVVDALITNFHLPQSTLLMLVTAFGGYDEVLSAYRHAVRAGYRFFSYGDAMLLTRNTRNGRF